MSALCALLALLVATVGALPLEKTEASNLSPQRTAYLMEHFLAGGSKNVRWETAPMSVVDAKGNPVKGVGNADCMDANGQTRKEGEEYERASGKFKYKCVKGEEEVTACVGSERANKARIGVGENAEVGGFWHKCQSFPNGSVVYFEEPSCRDQTGKEVHLNDEFSVGSLRVACVEGGYKTVGCVYHEPGGQEVIIREGETKEAGKFTHNCKSVDGNLQYFSNSSGCTKLDKSLKEGDTLSENHLHYKCTNGLADITGCYAFEGKDLKVGEDFVKDNVVHRCYRQGPAIAYEEFPCHDDASCHPKPVDSGPDEVPSLGRGLKLPGFGSFAVVQRMGGSDSVQSPNTLKLDLDKVMMGRQG